MKITPNCFQCIFLDKITSNTSCGVLVYFNCCNHQLRIYGDPELVVCNAFEKKKETER